MISIDANILLYSYAAASPFQESAKSFIEELSQREDVALSEFILTEFGILFDMMSLSARNVKWKS